MATDYYREVADNLHKRFPNISPMLLSTIMPSTLKEMVEGNHPFLDDGDDEAFRLWFNAVFETGSDQEDDSE